LYISPAEYARYYFGLRMLRHEQAHIVRRLHHK
jgi:hypothetical protein